MVLLTRMLLGRRLSRRLKRKIIEELKWDHPLYGVDRTPVEGRMKGLMKGLHPITRTQNYLEQGIIFRDCVKIMTVNYGTYEDKRSSHEGIEKVVNLNIPQMRYKNPNVQIEVLENLTPTPFLTFYLDTGEKFYVDVDGKEQFEILSHVQKVIGKPKALVLKETEEVHPNPANFGDNYERKCLCIVEGQVPCSAAPLSTPGYAMALHGKNINSNPKKYVFGKEE